MTQADQLPVENVQDYPRPPALEPVALPIKVVLGGAVIVETDRAWRVLETHHAPTYYVPPEDVDAEAIAVPGQSFCEWKGAATYFDLRAAGQTAKRAAWSYAAPTKAFAQLAGYLSFYPSRMERCFVGSVQAVPQPGDFYGGWVTPNLTGRVKGAPGTTHW